MKIYTYYQEINHAEQNELIDLWKMSWSRQGYQPIVLKLKDAKKHPYFDTLNLEIRKIFKQITGKEISDYGMSCWFRWLAYATQADEKFYVSDYDAINANFEIKEPDNKLHLMDEACPFLASGRPKQFEALCKAFIEVSHQRIDSLKKQAWHYHDQEFFMYNFVERFNPLSEKLKEKYDILITRNRNEIGAFYDPITKTTFTNNKAFKPTDADNYGVFHIAHHNAGSILDKYPQLKEQYCGTSLRIKMIKDILNIE